MTRRYGFAFACATIWAALVACSAGTDSSGASGSLQGEGGDGSGASGNGSGASGNTGGSAASSSGSSSNGGDGFGAGFGVGTGGTGGSSGGEGTCAENVYQPEAVEQTTTIEKTYDCTADAPEPIALYIVLDNSGSMDDDGKWTDAVNAITTFVNSDLTEGSQWACKDENGVAVPPPADFPPPGAVSVAIQYFHPVDSFGDVCDGSAHSTPAVPMAPLPGNATAITDSLASTGPDGNTPTVGALTGGVEYCQAYQAANPDVRCVNVLVTDGQPNGCGLSSSCGGWGSGNDCVDADAQATLTPIASGGYTDANSVLTFTIGMAGVTTEGFTLLDAIAVAGGSDCTPDTPAAEACNVTTTGAQGLIDALNTIRETVQVTGTSSESITTTETVVTTLPCEWTIPEPDQGEVFNKNMVNVEIAIGGTAPQTLGNVANAEECAQVGGGWYYDDNQNPTRIHACPGTCQVLESSTDASVNVLLGCETQRAIPR